MTGFTKFDNQLLERILTSKFTGRQLKILLLLLRYSIGYQKTYAVVRKSDFAMAGVSPSAISEELRRLYWLGVIRWDPARNLIWINHHQDEWTVENVGVGRGRASRIAAQNSLKWQWTILENSNFPLAKTGSLYKERSKQLKENKETFSSLLQDYFLNVAPLDGHEAAALFELARAYGSHTVREAIKRVALDNDRSFDHFLKAAQEVAKGQQGRLGFSSIQAGLENLARKFRPR